MLQSSRLFGTSFVVLGVLGVTGACADAEDPEARGSGGRNVGTGGRFVAGSASGGRSPSAGFGGSAGTSASAGQGVGGGAGPGGADAGGAAGTDNGQGGTPDVPLPEACEPSGAVAGAGGAASTPLVLELKANTNAPEEFPSGEVQLTNEGATNLALNGFELRYYMQTEYDPEQTDRLLVAIDHAQVSGRVYRTITQNVDGDVVVLDRGVAGADAYLSISFETTAGMLMPGETTLIQFRVTPPQGDASYYEVPRDQSNDYSFGACSLHATPFRRLVLLQSGEYASGDPPRGIDGMGGGGAGGAGGAAGASSDLGGAGVGGAGY